MAPDPHARCKTGPVCHECFDEYEALMAPAGTVDLGIPLIGDREGWERLWLEDDLRERDREAVRRIREAGLDIHKAMTEPLRTDPYRRSVLGIMTARGNPLTHAEIQRRRPYKENAA